MLPVLFDFNINPTQVTSCSCGPEPLYEPRYGSGRFKDMQQVNNKLIFKITCKKLAAEAYWVWASPQYSCIAKCSAQHRKTQKTVMKPSALFERVYTLNRTTIDCSVETVSSAQPCVKCKILYKIIPDQTSSSSSMC